MKIYPGMTPIDRTLEQHIGSKLRTLRTTSELTMEALGKAIGVSFQQIQKYEKGENRLTVSRLLQIAKACNVTPNFAFEHIMEGAPQP